MVLCNKVLMRSPTNKVGKDVTESVQMHVWVWGNFQKLGIGSLMLTSKPVTGFENSIDARN